MACPAILHEQQGREAVAVLRAEPTGGQLEAIDGLGIEGGREAKQAIGL